MRSGCICLDYSATHFGHPKNLIKSGRADTIKDGWEILPKVCTTCLDVIDCITLVVKQTCSEWLNLKYSQTFK